MKCNDRDFYKEKVRKYVLIYLNIYEKLIENKRLTDLEYDYLYILDTYFNI